MSDEIFNSNEKYEILKFIKEQPGSISHIDLVAFIEDKFPNKTYDIDIQRTDFIKVFVFDENQSLLSINKNKSIENNSNDQKKSEDYSFCYYHTNIEYRKYIDKILKINNFHGIGKKDQKIIKNIEKLKDNFIYAIDEIELGNDNDEEIEEKIFNTLGMKPDDSKYSILKIYIEDKYLLGKSDSYIVKNFDSRKYSLGNFKNSNKKPIFFVGEKTTITDPSFDFENCVFLSDEVEFNFDNNKIKLSKENNTKNIFSFRDAHFNCKKIVFNNLQIYGDENYFDSEISFEDAQFYCDEIIFNKSIFVNTKVNFFQTQLNSNSNADDNKYLGCTFIECIFKNSYIDFEDSKIKIPLSFVNINDFPNANFLFNEAENLMLHNCILNNRIKIANTKKLSLKNSISSDIIETPFCIKDNLDSNKKDCSDMFKKFKVFCDIDYGDYDIIRAVVDNNDSEESKASQLALLKESYHSLGQYEAEDIAFGASRKYGESNKFVNFILSLSNYGTNSLKFFVIVFICMIIIPVIIYLPSIFCLSFSDYEGFLRVFLDSFSDFFLTNYDESGNILDNIFSAILGLIGLFAFGYLLTIVIKKLDR